MHLATKSWQIIPLSSWGITAARVSAASHYTLSTQANQRPQLPDKDFLSCLLLIFAPLSLWMSWGLRYVYSGRIRPYLGILCVVICHYLNYCSQGEKALRLPSRWSQKKNKKYSGTFSCLLWLIELFFFNSEIFHCLSGRSLKLHINPFGFIKMMSGDYQSSQDISFGVSFC